MMAWSKARLEGLVKGIKAEMSAMEGSAEITGLKDITGEATLTTRKGNKKFAHYDLTLTLSWEGEAVAEEGTEKVAGELKVTEFETGNEDDEIAMASTVEGTTSAAKTRMKKSVLSVRPALLAALQKFADEIAVAE
mmetsp:Transcript_27428/g.87900  ORF Transcript_27428/g.87900 Transcript_27428/m.87900 type:complete len:136 (+) Transcript_27428:354-761(+)